jgi:hypothetical protein
MHLEDRQERQVAGGEELAFRYVDREVFPLRTALPDGPRPDPRTLDLLLVDGDGRPIVGELKIRHDSLPYVALIQSLMYAAELSSASQLARLVQYYGDEAGQPIFRVHERQSPLDIYLISFEPEGTNSEQSTFTTMEICDLLMADARVNGSIGQIAFVEAVLDAKSGELTFGLMQSPRDGETEFAESSI